jgi:CubicO group peptidase (beta-lactamase class C family)
VTKTRIAVVVLVAAVMFGQQTSAQTLTFSLLGRYLDSLREQAGIPGMSGIVLQNGSPVWRYQSGKQDLETNLSATTDTPYYITGVSQVLGSALLLKKCVDESYLEVSDRVLRWDPSYGESQTTVKDLLTHIAPSGGYRFDLARFSEVAPVVNQCASTPYRRALASFFEQNIMFRSVPNAALATPTTTDARLFDAATLQRYASIVGSVATPYRVAAGRATKSDFSGASLDPAIGVISTAEDLGRFDTALSRGLLDTETLKAAWSRSGPSPLGLGWFVQGYNNEPVVWQFGVAKDAYSSLFLKLPNRGITFILLANSDGLSAPFALENGDVTTSLFAKTFLRLVTGS